jgi:hypothetical protein
LFHPKKANNHPDREDSKVQIGKGQEWTKQVGLLSEANRGIY